MQSHQGGHARVGSSTRRLALRELGTMKTSIIGCGNIGNKVAQYIDTTDVFDLVSVVDIEPVRISSLISNLHNNSPVPATIEEAIRNSELIIEAATPDTVGDILNFLQQGGLPRCSGEEKILLIMSSGGLIYEYEKFKRLKNCRVIVPSGAIAGLDAIKAVAGKIDSLVLRTTKPCKSLRDAPFVRRNNLDLDLLDMPKVIFEGNLKEAVTGFPQNINSAATLYLASGFDDMRVTIVADPGAKFNTHEIICQGSFGTISTKTENLPSENPRTSALAVMSVLSELENLTKHLPVFLPPPGRDLRSATKKAKLMIGELV
jgi:aspartate dehydrogenase